MSNFNRYISNNIFVKVGAAKASLGDIETNALGPCLCLLLDFMRGSEPMCFLHHYNSEMPETDVPLPELLEEYLKMMPDKLKMRCGIASLTPISAEEPGISDLRLLVAGGDIEGRTAAKDAFSLLNENHMMFKSTSDTDLSYLYRQLAHHTIVPKSVTKDLSDDEESEG